MKSGYLDDAFNWLVVLLSTIAATMCQFPELVPVYRQGESVGPTVVIRATVFPILALVVLWLAGSLARKTWAQAVWKSLSWMYASLVLAADIVLLLTGSVPAVQQRFASGEAGILQSTIFLELVIAVPFYAFVIRPRMRGVYRDLRFVHGFLVQAVLAVTGVGLYLLAVGAVEGILGAGPF